jgi:hypothetical protein
MYEAFQSWALTLCKRLSRSQRTGEVARLGGVAETRCMFGALGDLLIRVLLGGVDAGLGDSLSDALIIMSMKLS